MTIPTNPPSTPCPCPNDTQGLQSQRGALAYLCMSMQSNLMAQGLKSLHRVLVQSQRSQALPLLSKAGNESDCTQQESDTHMRAGSSRGNDRVNPSLWVDLRGHRDIQVPRQSCMVIATASPIVVTPNSEMSYFYSP